MEFLYNELTTSYSSLVAKLQAAKSVSEASNLVLLNFEKPAD
jgi:hypothetical protein